MNKTDILKIVALLVVVGFLAEPLWFGGGLVTFFGSSQQLQSGTNISGTAVFNGTIRTYDPFLYIEGSIQQSVIDQLNVREEVSGMEQTGNGLLVSVDTRDDVYQLALFLRQINVTSYTRANLIVDQAIEVKTLTGIVNVTMPSGVVQLICEPLVDADTEVPVTMTATLQNNQIISYEASLIVSTENLTANAKVDSINMTTYTYTIPWDERNSLDLSKYDNVKYTKVDSIVFTEPLSVSQILAKKSSFSFIEYIDSSSAQVNSSFNDLDQLEEAFGDVGFTLPPSTLVITSDEEPALDYEHTTLYTYSIYVDSTTIGENYFNIDSAAEYQIEDEIELTIEVLSLGDKVIEIRRVSLPS
jgi:hypothetical protein